MAGIDPGILRSAEQRVAYQWVCRQCGEVNRVRTVVFTPGQYDSCDFRDLRACEGLPGGMVVMAPRRMECRRCSQKVQNPAVDGLDGVFLEACYGWTCEDCGRDNMQRGCLVPLSEPRQMSDGSEASTLPCVGMFPPLLVCCPHCGSWFRDSMTTTESGPDPFSESSGGV